MNPIASSRSGVEMESSSDAVRFRIVGAAGIGSVLIGQAGTLVVLSSRDPVAWSWWFQLVLFGSYLLATGYVARESSLKLEIAVALPAAAFIVWLVAFRSGTTATMALGFEVVASAAGLALLLGFVLRTRRSGAHPSASPAGR